VYTLLQEKILAAIKDRRRNDRRRVCRMVCGMIRGIVCGMIPGRNFCGLNF
jgi:hypothetical protein